MTGADTGVDDVDAHARPGVEELVAAVERLVGRIDAVETPRRDRRLRHRRREGAQRGVFDRLDVGELETCGDGCGDGERGAVVADREDRRFAVEQLSELVGQQLGTVRVDREDDVVLVTRDRDRRRGEPRRHRDLERVAVPRQQAPGESDCHRRDPRRDQRERESAGQDRAEHAAQRSTHAPRGAARGDLASGGGAGGRDVAATQLSVGPGAQWRGDGPQQAGERGVVRTVVRGGRGGGRVGVHTVVSAADPHHVTLP